MLNQIKSIISNGIKVEVKDMNQYQQYPVVVQDVTEGSITKGWALTYYPRLYTNGNTRLYDGKETFSNVQIANFTSVFNQIMELDRRFVSGENVEVSQNRRRARYEYPTCIFNVSEASNSVEFRLSITDSKSPFHMLGITFRVMTSKKDGSRHLIGSDDRWDRNTDIFSENNGYMSPKKKRVLAVYQEDNNSIPYVRANSRMGMNGVTQVDPKNSEFLYIQDISSEYRALAYIYEKNILNIALEKALEQIQAKSNKPASNQNAFSNGFSNGFTNPQMNQGPFASQPAFNQQPQGFNNQNQGNGFMQNMQQQMAQQAPFLMQR